MSGPTWSHNGKTNIFNYGFKFFFKNIMYTPQLSPPLIKLLGIATVCGIVNIWWRQCENHSTCLSFTSSTYTSYLRVHITT